MNYYQVLGVATNATADEIKAAYRTLAAKWHPDRNSSSNASEMFQKIQAAYVVLKNPEKRKVYDDSGYSYTIDQKEQYAVEGFQMVIQQCLNDSEYAPINYLREARIHVERRISDLSKVIKAEEQRKEKLTKLLDTHKGEQIESLFNKLYDVCLGTLEQLEEQCDIALRILELLEMQEFAGTETLNPTNSASGSNISIYISPQS